MEVTAAVAGPLRRRVLRHRRLAGHATGVGAGRSRPAGSGRTLLLRLGRPAPPRRPGACPLARRDTARPGVRAWRAGSLAGPAGWRLPGGRRLLRRCRPPGGSPGAAVRAGGQGAVRGRRPRRDRAGGCRRRRRGVRRRPALRRRRPGGRPGGAAGPPAGPPARPDRLAAEDRGGIPGCRAAWVSTGRRRSARPAWRRLPSRPGPSGTSCSPGSTRSRWSSTRPVTGRSRRCRPRPACTCRWPGWSSG
jgi:hypothetical protein